jgi:hypothetical protein
MMMERLWTVRDVMEIIPLGKTRCVAIVNSLPHISLGGKLMIDPKYIREWIISNTKCGTQKTSATAQKKPRPRKAEGLTADGMIPYRKRGA